MTARCSSTTSVRKVRVRSSAKLRVLTFGAAATSIVATEGEIVLMLFLGPSCPRVPASALLPDRPIDPDQRILESVSLLRGGTPHGRISGPLTQVNALIASTSFRR